MYSRPHFFTLPHFGSFCKLLSGVLLLLIVVACTNPGRGDFELPTQSPLERAAPLAVFVVTYGRILGDPKTESSVQFMARAGDIFKIMDRSTSREIVNGHVDYWYRVEFLGQSGWVFGTNLQLCHDELVARYAAERILKEQFP
jgi:hypothetical protein